MEVLIREAEERDSGTLTEISFAAKRHWNYPEEYFEIWQDELTITPCYIRDNQVWVAECGNVPVGYCSLVEVKKGFWAEKVFVEAGFWLEHIFIQPSYLRQGIGRRLIDCIDGYCRTQKIGKVLIFSDPNARGFYDALGALYMGEVASNIEGRTVSYYQLYIQR